MRKYFFFFACLACVLLGFTNCKDSSEDPRKGTVTFYGTVTDTNGTPLNGVLIKIGGSDILGSSTITGADGAYECPLSIIPTRKSEKLTFVIAAKKDGAQTYRIGKFGTFDGDDLDWIGEDKAMGTDYGWLPEVAYAAKIEVGWDVVGERISHSFMIEMKE